MQRPSVKTLASLAAALALAAGSAFATDIRGANNAVIGKIDADGTVRNASNATIGKIASDGTVRNASNATIGKVDSDGTVRNASNATIGTAKGVKRSWAAAYFFFFFRK